MLSPIDVHYIVGFLSLAAGPDNVEVELGDFVYDQATRTRRDVDVTITTRNADGSQTAFKGLEVKAHTRRLNSEHVEQLVQKLADMPAITNRAIVSASGFTKPAIRKAQHHNVDLYELRDWDPATGYDYFKAETVPAARESYGWVGNLEVRVNPHREHTPEERVILSSDPHMYLESSPEPKYNLNGWLNDVSKLAAKEAAARAGAVPREGKHHTHATVTVQFTDKAFAIKDNARVPVRSVRFSGILERRVEQLPTVMKALQKLGEKQPVAGCAISDFGDFGLVALIISNRRTLEFAQVPISDRNKRKVLGHHLRHAPDSHAPSGDKAT
ncbi:hypothetical protein BH20VER3_BH20VER3_00040 [soil metagenome]